SRRDGESESEVESSRCAVRANGGVDDAGGLVRRCHQWTIHECSGAILASGVAGARIVTHHITDQFAIYLGDCCEVLRGFPDDSVHLSIYSPPFAGLYNYSSNPRDMSNCRSREEFFAHYRFMLAELARVMMPGRISAVH